MKSVAMPKKPPVTPAEWERLIAAAPGKDRALTPSEEQKMARGIVVNGGGYSAVRAALAEVERRLEQTQHALEESQAAQQTVMRARRREADEVYLVGIAGEVFNRAPQAATIGLLVGLHGTPAVRIDVEGIELPRRVHIQFGWPQGGRDYRVDVDLVARRFDLIDLVPGSDGRLVELTEPFYANAEWIDGRIVTAPAEPTMM